MKKQIQIMLLICLICLPCTLFSDEDEVIISGMVRDVDTGKPVSYIPVQCIHETDTVSTESGLDGRYKINLPISMFVDIKQASQNHLPSDFYLEQNYPNPFNPATTIQFSIPQNTPVHLAIYNILGQKVKTLMDKTCSAGIHAVVWDASDQTGQGVSAGLYFYRLQAGDYTNVKKMILLDGSMGTQRSMGQPVVLTAHEPQPLLKSNSYFVTIRANCARIQPFEQTQVLLTSQEMFFDIDVSLLDVSGFDKDRVLVSKPDPGSKVYVCGLPMAVVDSLSEKETVIITNNRTFEKVAVDLEANGGFSTIALSGELYDTLSICLFNDENLNEDPSQKIGETLELSVYSSNTPQVCDSSPSNGDKDIIVDAEIIIRFSIPMDVATINQQNFLLSSEAGIVDGSISFDDNMTVRFTPDQPLVPSTVYTITLTTNVTSLWGVPLHEDYVSSFMTLTTGTVVQQLQATLDEQLEMLGLTGLSAAIIFPDKSVWLGASGMSDPVSNDSMRTNMIFHTGRIAKNFTATVVLQLVEEGKLSLEDPLHKWLPTFPNIDSTITVRQLLNNSSGLYAFSENPSFLPTIISDLNKYWTYEEILLTFQKEPYAKPGVVTFNSDTNYLLLSWIIEKVTSVFFPVEMENRFGNLSVLDHTYFTWYDTIPEDFAHPWFDLNNDGIADDILDKYKTSMASVSYGMGGMYSTAANQAQWMKYLFEGGCLSQESLDQMLTLEYSTNIGYGIGVMEWQEYDRNFLGYLGWSPGFTASAVYSPRDSLSIAILSNDNESLQTPIAGALLEVIYISMKKYPKLSFDDSALYFGDIPGHLSMVDTTFFIYNSGRSVDSVFVSLSYGSVESNAFSVEPPVFKIAPGESQEITYRIYPNLLSPKMYRTILKLESKFSPITTSISKSILFNIITS